MSISFNHPKDTMTSTSTLNLIVLGGSPSTPRPIRFNASSVIMPVRALPTGEAGAMVFDTSSKTMKYHDGSSWIELLDASAIIAPIQISLQDIYNKLNKKVETVTYTSSAVPNASISGTNLNIVFPTPSSSGSGPSGLFTASKPGSIMHYSLSSGQGIANIREQMSGVVNGQAGRNGTQGAPYKTSDGWCLSDGMYWLWEGPSGNVLKQVPNLNQEAYLKSISLSGITKTDSPIPSSGNASNESLSVAQLPPLTFTVSGSTNAAGEHVHQQFYNPMGWSGTSGVKDGTGRDDTGSGVHVTQPAGNHIHTFAGTTNTLGSGQTHTHTLMNVDVAHFNVAVLYNIAESTVALSETVANSRYVLKGGDVMTGSLTIANSATISANDTSLPLYFRNASGGERAAIYHSSSTNTLRLRSAGGSEVVISTTGALTVPSNTTIGGTLAVTGAASTGALNVAGQITATGDIWAFSDERLKENIVKIDNSLDKVDAIDGVLGNMIGEERVRSMVLAQQVQQVLPEAVEADENGFLKVNYQALIPLLLNAVSDLRNEVNELRGKK